MLYCEKRVPSTVIFCPAANPCQPRVLIVAVAPKQVAPAILSLTGAMRGSVTTCEADSPVGEEMDGFAPAPYTATPSPFAKSLVAAKVKVLLAEWMLPVVL